MKKLLRTLLRRAILLVVLPFGAAVFLIDRYSGKHWMAFWRETWKDAPHLD